MGLKKSKRTHGSKILKKIAFQKKHPLDVKLTDPKNKEAIMKPEEASEVAASEAASELDGRGRKLTTRTVTKTSLLTTTKRSRSQTREGVGD